MLIFFPFFLFKFDFQGFPYLLKFFLNEERRTEEKEIISFELNEDNEETEKEIVTMAKTCGYQMNVDTGKELAKSLMEIEAKSKNETNTEKHLVSQMLKMLTTRCMTQAVYFASGTLAADQYLHYGLAAKVYTHFTSPIRRYADVMVHRLLATLINVDKVHPSMVDRRKLIRQTENMNKRHRQAQYASRASVLLNTFLMIKQHPESSLDAIVIGIRKNGIQIHVPKFGLESVIFINESDRSMKDRTEMFEVFDGKIRLFQKIRISLNLEERNQRRRINVKLIEPFIEGISIVTDCDPEIA